MSVNHLELYDPSDSSATPTSVCSQKSNASPSMGINYTLPPSQTDLSLPSRSASKSSAQSSAQNGSQTAQDGSHRPIYDRTQHTDEYSGTLTPIIVEGQRTLSRSGMKQNGSKAFAPSSNNHPSNTPSNSPSPIPMDTSEDEIAKSPGSSKAVEDDDSTLIHATLSKSQSLSASNSMSGPRDYGHSQLHSPNYFSAEGNRLLRKISSLAKLSAAPAQDNDTFMSNPNLSGLKRKRTEPEVTTEAATGAPSVKPKVDGDVGFAHDNDQDEIEDSFEQNGFEQDGKENNTAARNNKGRKTKRSKLKLSVVNASAAVPASAPASASVPASAPASASVPASALAPVSASVAPVSNQNNHFLPGFNNHQTLNPSSKALPVMKGAFKPFKK